MDGDRAPGQRGEEVLVGAVVAEGEDERVRRGRGDDAPGDGALVHPVRPEPWGTSLRQQKKSFYNALIFKKHPRLYWQIIQPAPPWHFYAMAFFATWVLISLLLQLPWLAALCGLAWLVLYARFAFQRLKDTSHKPEHVLEMLVTSLTIPFLSIYWRIRGAIHWGVLFF